MKIKLKQPDEELTKEEIEDAKEYAEEVGIDLDD